ncbi:MAG: hypothetical protein HQK60_08965 [Deltaproteobacteria bacterium]|nr:hypothetical protein [Deltaproteobacteria bacterium]
MPKILVTAIAFVTLTWGCLMAVSCVHGPNGLAMNAAVAAESSQPAGDVKPPVVKLDHIEFAKVWPGFFMRPATKWECKDGKAEPVKESILPVGSVMVVDFIFTLENPNTVPVKMEEAQFTIAFEPGFDVNTVTYFDHQWIPGGKTNYLRISATFDAATTAGNLAVTSGFKLKEMGLNAGDLLKKWWGGADNKEKKFDYWVEVKNGTATFALPGGNVISSFAGKYKVE